MFHKQRKASSVFVSYLLSFLSFNLLFDENRPLIDLSSIWDYVSSLGGISPRGVKFNF